MIEKMDCVVVGAGVVGLAVAREFALAGREVIVIEAEDAIGTHTSSRNSEVITPASTIRRIRSRRAFA
jgi:L-2-hydroxyglutarate oxidase LhgO